MKLDNLHKALVATGQINYMVASLYSVNQQMKMIPDDDVKFKEIFSEQIKDMDKVLEKSVKDLGKIMENLGNCINRWDAVSAIDQRVATVPFDIVVHGKDDTEKDYEDEQ